MTNYDILIIGAGPAGLSAASYASRAGYSVIVLDSMGPGGQLMVIDQIENYPGVESISGFQLAEKFEKQCNDFGASIDYSSVDSLIKVDDGFIAKTSTEEIKSKAVIIATGASHRKLEVPGEAEYSGKGVSYCATCDGPFFKGKEIVVVGGGDTALTDALYLSKLCKKVTLIHRRDKFRAQKVLQDRINNTPNIECIMSNNVRGIYGDGSHVTHIILDDEKRLDTDGVFILVGTIPNSSIADGLCALDGGYIVTDAKMATTCPGIFAAGDVRNTSFKQVVTAAGDGARAAHSVDEYIQGL